MRNIICPTKFRKWHENATYNGGSIVHCAKVHLMTFDLYNYQTPRWPNCRTSKICWGDIGLSENNSAENSPWGRGGAIASSKSILLLRYVFDYDD